MKQYGNFTSTNIISFGEDKQGELYILKQGVSTLFKITSKTTGFGNTPTIAVANRSLFQSYGFNSKCRAYSLRSSRIFLVRRGL